MKVLGIDPGMALLGWGVIETTSSQPKLVDYGCIETASHQPLTERLLQIFRKVKGLLSKYRPSALALETLFFVKNAKTLAQVGHSRGVILLAAGRAKVDVFEYAPRQIKMALTGYGGAEKRQMQIMIQRLLNLPEIPRPDDAADAVAVALCHAQYSPSMRRSALTV